MAQKRRNQDGIGAIGAVSSRRRKPGAMIGTKVDHTQGKEMTKVSRTGGIAGGRRAGGPKEKSVWLRDRVTLSIEAQLLLMEMRRTNPIDLDAMEYNNRVDTLEVKSNIYVDVLPFGAYRLKFRG